MLLTICWYSVQVLRELFQGIKVRSPESGGYRTVTTSRIKSRVIAMATLAEGVAQLSLQPGSEEHAGVVSKEKDMEEVGDPYRDHLSGAGEKDTAWRHDYAPRYESVNALFENGRTQVSSPSLS